MANEDLRDTLLQLVRLGIGTSKDAKISNDVDWIQLKALADKQGLTAVVLDGLNEVLKTNSQLSPLNLQLKLSWIGEVMQNYEVRYQEYEKAISSLAGFYNQHGVKMMVLKGYACSLDWPNPKHRPCGDIDIWQFGKQAEADRLITLELGVKIDTSEQHHTVFDWQGFMVENHYDIIDVHHRRSSAKLERLLKKLAEDDTSMVKISGEVVYVPSVNLHALFLVYHTMLHFTSTEMSIRQILDWAFFVKKHGNDVDWTWLLNVLKDYHLIEFFNILDAICVDELGFDCSIFPDMQFNPLLKERILNDTLCPEFSEPEPADIFKRFFFRYRRWKSHEWKHRLCYDESMFSIFLSAFWSHLLKPKTI